MNHHRHDASRPDHTSPWVLDTRTLGRRPGSMKQLSRTITAERPIGLEVLAVPAGAPLDLQLRLESVAEGVLVSGTAAAETVGECSRCLKAISGPVSVSLRELYAYPESTTAATTESDEIPLLVDDLIDMEPLVTDELVTALPLAPLCRADCPGLCQTCGEPLDEMEPGHSHEILDPRWSVLRDRLVVASPEQPDIAPVDQRRN